ncbi:hypothetical protein SISNIDRAFT_491020 [Sistotremastrum niveocremeum HHB9708]|uniref:F-box domain-containing protein n=1 Tax=Sistotremastrum niveocremeum HHB9708 TaxID=1314777 RepID=A0A164N8C5_9AGAM|nr:hypothetical protein SISNIDRAFT_491020 [Sistotremastrum niveocremeum HHB9708]
MNTDAEFQPVSHMLENIQNLSNMVTSSEKTSYQQSQTFKCCILLLPEEIMSAIFLHSLRYGEKIYWPQRYTLMLVCRLWRLIALNTPQFWTRVHLGGPRRLQEFYLQRSNPLPLDLTIPNGETVHAWSDITHRTDLLARARAIDITVPSRTIANPSLYPLTSTPLLDLEELTIRVPVRYTLHNYHFSNILEVLSARAELSPIISAISIIFWEHNVYVFPWDWSLMRLLDAISKFQSLTVLEFSHKMFRNTGTPWVLHGVVFPHVRMLKFDAVKADAARSCLDAASFPMLETLFLSTIPNFDPKSKVHNPFDTWAYDWPELNDALAHLFPRNFDSLNITFSPTYHKFELGYFSDSSQETRAFSPRLIVRTSFPPEPQIHPVLLRAYTFICLERIKIIPHDHITSLVIKAHTKHPLKVKGFPEAVHFIPLFKRMGNLKKIYVSGMDIRPLLKGFIEHPQLCRGLRVLLIEWSLIDHAMIQTLRALRPSIHNLELVFCQEAPPAV